MGTAILRSQDCLRGRFRHEALALTLTPRSGWRRSPNFSNPNPTGAQSRRRKRSPVGVQSNHRDRCGGDRVVAKVPGRNLVMGQVKILKRGEALSPAMNDQRVVGAVKRDDRKPRVKSVEYSDSDLVLGSTDRLGPDPATVQKQIKAAEFKVMDAIYAGSGDYYASPPPSSVPLPAFLAKNGAATSDLRRLLRIDLV
ncbi:uncharacterized protein LOC126785042 [Argentina anserina]|uniref:uncharacterized protein LOC126785042 n=1 Tax=Argentina anserina TaxID=57926 RepID=UPI00217626D1|nr:uncharacterized protein LOC126785042 [Potentilla anserina]